MKREYVRRLLVVGVQPGNLGDAVMLAAQSGDAFKTVVGADISDNGLRLVDVTDRKSVVQLLEDVRPTDIVCSVGLNLPDGEAGMIIRNMKHQLLVNTIGPTILCMEAIDMWMNSMLPPPSGFNFCAVSSNSAHVARSESAGYCASKAALSASLRSIARRWAHFTRVWGYEPGWIVDTPMSEEVRMRLKTGVQPHRIPGGMGLRKDALARRIVSDVVHAEHYLNGCMLRLDGGEQ